MNASVASTTTSARTFLPGVINRCGSTATTARVVVQPHAAIGARPGDGVDEAQRVQRARSAG